MKRLQYIGKIDQTGNFTGPDADRIRQGLRETFAGQFVVIEVTGWINPPSKGLKATYFQIVIPAVLAGLRDLGNDVDPNRRDHRESCHKRLSEQFLEGRVLKDGAGNEIMMPPTTKDLSDAGWRRYLDQIRIWAAENLGINITV